jgi:hydrogenase maturation protease
VRVIGVGNDYRGDDAAGLVVARAVRARVPHGVDVHEARGDATDLIHLWSGATRVVVVDAMRSGAPAGTVVRLDARDLDGWPGGSVAARASSHALGVLEAVTLARTLGLLPRALVVYGIEGESFGVGEALSPGVARILPSVVDRIVNEVTGRTLAGERQAVW